MALKHAFTSPKTDGADSTLVQPSAWNADHVIDHLGATFTAGSPDPTLPSAGQMVMWAKNRGGRLFANVMGPSGVDTSLQPALFGNTVIQWLPTTGTTLHTGGGITYVARNSGTGAAQSHPTISITNALTRMSRASFGTGTTATGASGICTAAPVAFRGDITNQGGFFFAARFGVEASAAGIRAFIGLSGNNATMAANPSTWVNTVGICIDSTDTTWHFLRSSGALATKYNTGCTVGFNQILDMYMYIPPDGSSMTVRLVDPVTNTVYTDNVTLTTNLPDAFTPLYMQAHIQSTMGTTAKILSLNKMYLEKDI